MTTLGIQYPHFTIDHHANAAYVTITDFPDEDEGGVARTEPVTDHINADYDAMGNVVGIEFLSLKIDLGEEFKLRVKP